MDSLPPRPMIVFLIVLFVLSVINTLARKSSVAVSDAWLKQKASDGNKRAKKLFKMLDENSAGLIDGMELFSVLLLILMCSVTALIVYNPVCIGIANIFNVQSPNFGIHIIAVFIIAVCICLLYMIFAVNVPGMIGAKNSEKISLMLTGYCGIILVAAKPFLWLSVVLSKLLSTAFGAKYEDINEEVTEEEIRMMVDIGSESGVIDDDEKQMIHNIFEMDDKPAEDIMTHRTEVCVLWREDDIDEWKNVIDETNHTRYPVCGESIDDVIGVVNSRDFYRLLLSGSKDTDSILRDPWFVPDTIKADELLSKMQTENEHMGIIMDEYGGFQGIVTQEDLIEEIVGELYSEYDEPEAEETDIIRIAEDMWKIDGAAEIGDVEENLGVKLPEGDYNTFAGLILNEIQTIPDDGEKVELQIERLVISVVSVEDHRIDKTVVRLLPEEIDEEDEKSDK